MADQQPAPNLYSATANVDGTVDLVFGGDWEPWSDLTIQRRVTGSTYWNTLDTVTAQETEWTDENASQDTQYDYRVKPTGYVASDTESVWTYPGAVTNLAVTAVANEGSVNMSWDNEVGGYGLSASTRIYYKKSSDSSYSHTDIALSASAVLTGLDEGVDYDFKVAILGGGSLLGTESAAVTGVTTNIPAPTGLGASSVAATTIRLTWTDNSDYEAGFQIHRDGVYLTNLPAGTEQYDNEGLDFGTTYAYKVRAYVANNYSTFTSEVECQAGVAPATPTLDSVTTADIDEIAIAFTPDGITDDIEIFQSEDDATYESIGLFPAATSPAAVTGLTSNTLYYFKIRAVNVAGVSALTESDSDTTDADLRPPTDLDATASSDTQINTTWTHLGVDRTYYKLERQITGGSWEVVDDEIDPDVEEYLDGGLIPEKEYSYRLSIIFEAATGDPSDTATATTDSAGEVPTKMDSLFGMGNLLCQMNDGLQDVRDITRKWVSKEFDFSDMDPANFHHWKFIDKIQLEYEDIETDCPITVGVSANHGISWSTRTINVGANTGAGRIRDFRFVPIPGIYFQVYVQCADRDKDIPWTGLYIHFDVGGEHFDTGTLD